MPYKEVECKKVGLLVQKSQNPFSEDMFYIYFWHISNVHYHWIWPSMNCLLACLLHFSDNVHCTALYCTALYCTALHFIVLHWSALHSTTMDCLALNPCRPVSGGQWHWPGLLSFPAGPGCNPLATLQYISSPWHFNIGLLKIPHTGDNESLDRCGS